MKSSFSPFQKLFIYSRREMVVLTTLCLTIGLFTFTLGIHLGKEVSGQPEPTEHPGTKVVGVISDQIPSNQELLGPNKTTSQALEDSLNEALHEEVVRTGIRLNPTFQTELPGEAKAENGGATTLKHADEMRGKSEHGNGESHHERASKAMHEATSEHTEETNRKISSVEEPAKEKQVTQGQHSEVEERNNGGAYSLQIGSFPNLKEAEKSISDFSHLDLQPTMKEVDVKGKGKWFRLYLGSFTNMLDAKKAGNSYIAQHKIKSFIVSKLAD